MSEFRYDLFRACDHCPFRRDEGRIKFSCRERAEEIEESAYRHGFVCHEHAEWLDEDDDPINGGGATGALRDPARKGRRPRVRGSRSS